MLSILPFYVCRVLSYHVWFWPVFYSITGNRTGDIILDKSNHKNKGQDY